MNSDNSKRQPINRNKAGAPLSTERNFPSASQSNDAVSGVLIPRVANKPRRHSRTQKKLRSTTCVLESFKSTPPEKISETGKKAIDWSIGFISKKLPGTANLDPTPTSIPIAPSNAGWRLSLATTAQESHTMQQGSVEKWPTIMNNMVCTTTSSDMRIECTATSSNKRIECTATSSDKCKDIITTHLSYEHYKMKRTANQILELFEGTIPEHLSEKNLNSMAWAIAVVSSMSSSTAFQYSAYNRKRSAESSPNSPKRVKANDGGLISANQQSIPQGEELSRRQMYAIIDRSDPDGSISGANWRMIEGGLNTIYISLLRKYGGPAPTSFDEGWHHGHIKLLSFEKQRSADIFKLAIRKLGAIWSGAQLDVITLDEIPSRPRSRVLLPSCPSDPVDILRMIEVCNPDLPTKNWKIAKLGKPQEASMYAVIIVNNESLASLAETNGVIHYGFGTITLKVYRQSEKVYKEGEDCSGSSSTPPIKVEMEPSPPLQPYIKVEVRSPTSPDLSELV